MSIKEEFRSWLIEQGLQQEGKTGRKSTVDEYLRYIDNMCLKLYASNEWEKLIENKYVILFFYMLCNRSKYQKNKQPIDKILNDLTKRFSKSSIITEFKSYKSLEKKFEQQLPNRAYNKKTGVAFIKFYKFLEGKIAQFPLEEFSMFVSEMIKICVDYNKYKSSAIYGQYPKQIVAKDTETQRNITIDEMADFLECSRRTIERLLKKEKLDFSVTGVNQYLARHYHPSLLNKLDYFNTIFSNKWYSAEEAANVLGCSISTIKRFAKDGKISYTNYTPRNIKYLADDINLLLASKIKSNKNNKLIKNTK